jgi:hypothetical protein
MLFAGSTTANLTKSGLPQFEPLLSYPPADFTALEDQILNYTNPNSNRDSTDFIKALSEIYALLSTDITQVRNSATAAQARPCPGTSSSSSPTVTPPSTRTTSSSRVTRSSASGS